MARNAGVVVTAAVILVSLMAAAIHDPTEMRTTPAPVTSTGAAGIPGAGSQPPPAAGQPARTPPGPPFDGRLQWPLIALQARQLWRYAQGARVTVGVIDTGIANHSDLAAAILDPAHNLTGHGAADDGTDTSANSHGTAVAGIIAGRGLRAEGSQMTGLAPAASLLDIRVAADDSKLSASTAARGILAAVNHGASVINVSLTVAAGSPLLQSAVATAERHGAAVVATAGAGKTPQALAAYRGVIVVGPTSRASVPIETGTAGVALYAPGIDLFTTGEIKAASGAVASGYMTHVDGADYAAAYTSAAIALLLSADRRLTAAQAGRWLVSMAVREHGQSGAGVMNPLRALRAALAAGKQTPRRRPTKAHSGAAGSHGGRMSFMNYLVFLGVLLLLTAATCAFVLRRRRRLSEPQELPLTLWDQPW